MNIQTLEKLGVSFTTNFLTPFEAELMRQLADRLPGEAVQVVRQGTEQYAPEMRQGASVALPDDVEDKFNEKLAIFKLALEKQLSSALAGFEPAQLLVYGKEHYFKPHRDDSTHPDDPEYLKRRKMTVVLPVSRPGRDWQGGGELILYGLMQEPAFADCGFRIPLEPGTLIAFPSAITHEVTKIESGTRACLVTWFYY